MVRVYYSAPKIREFEELIVLFNKKEKQKKNC